MRPWIILCDFDGTVCPDATDEILSRCADKAWEAVERQWRDGLIGSRECMSRQIAMIDASEAELDAVLDGIAIDPAFPRFVTQARALGLELAIVSDGLDRAVHRILGNHGIDGLPMVANRLQRVSERGWQLSSPYADATCHVGSGTCKCAWARRAHGAHSTIGDSRLLLIGDGQSDFCAASRSDFVFAKSQLLAHCRANGLPHRPFNDFDEVIALLSDLVGGRLDDASFTVTTQAEPA